MEATTPPERLREGLSRARAAVNDATMAAALLRPNKPAERVKEALTHLREALIVATEAAGEVLRPRDRGDGMDRRGLLRTLSTAAATAVLPPGSLEHLVEVAQAVGRSRRVDAGLLDRLEAVTSSLAQRYYRSRPEELTGPVRGLTDMLARLLDDGTMMPDQRQRLAVLSADTSMFAGWLALDADLRADARAYFRTARDLAREAGDATLYALALESDGLMYALRTPDNRRGDPGRAVWQISQAHASLSDDAPAVVRAYVAVSEAKHRAIVGDQYGFQAGMVRAEQAIERLKLGQGPDSRGFMSSEGWLSVVSADNWLTDYEGRGLASLGHPDARAVLDSALAQDANPGRRTIMLLSLASVYLPDEPEQAVAVTTEAFDVASRSGYAVAYPAIDDVRAQLADDVPGVVELDERLATV